MHQLLANEASAATPASSSYDAAIERDGALLASLGFTEEQLRQDSNEAWEAFTNAGGDDGHSGASWSCVRACARRILTAGH